MKDLNVLGAYVYDFPGTESANFINALMSFFKGISRESAKTYIESVVSAYPEASAARGVPYQSGTAAGEWMAQSIASKTGLSFGIVKAVLNTMQSLASSGQVSNETYNPGEFSITAKVGKAISGAAKTAADTAKSITPDAVQDAIEKALKGAGAGVGGLGSLLEYLPYFVVGGLGIWAWQTGILSKKRAR